MFCCKLVPRLFVRCCRVIPAAKLNSIIANYRQTEAAGKVCSTSPSGSIHLGPHIQQTNWAVCPTPFLNVPHSATTPVRAVLYRTCSATTTILYWTLLHSTVLTSLQQQCLPYSTTLYHTHSATTTVFAVLYYTALIRIRSATTPVCAVFYCTLPYAQRYKISTCRTTLLHSM